MALASYSDLVTTVTAFMNRTDAAAVIPSFITLAEAEMNRKLRVRQMITRAHATIANEFETVPSNFCGEKTLTLDATPIIQLDYCDPDKIMYEKSRRSTVSGIPEMYSIQGDDLQLFPAPGDNYTARIVYYASIPGLTAVNTTNWLMTKYPDAYLYGALSQAGMWLRGDPRTANFVNAFETILGNIQDANIYEADAPRLEMPSRLSP